MLFLTSWSFLKRDDPLSLEFFLEQRWPVIIAGFQSTEATRFNWAFPGTKPSELVKPALLLPHYQNYDGDEIRLLFSVSQNCLDFPKKTPEQLAKAWQWIRFLCLHTPLTKDFFRTAPYLFPSGQSFVRLAQSEKLDLSPFLQEDEVLKFQSLTEEIAATQFGNELKLQQVEGLLAGEDVLMGTESVFLSDKSGRENTRDKTFLKISKTIWNNKMANEDFDFTDKLTGPCLRKTTNGCWTLNKRKNALKTKTLQSVLVLTDALLIAVGFWFFIADRKRRSRQKESHKFTLQMLTHELRTPVTTLGLLIENSRENFDKLSAAQQINFLKMTAEISRLKNSMQMSYAYLQTDAVGSQRMKINFEMIDLNFFISEHLESNELGKVQFVPLASPLMIKAERFWLSLCLNNLIKNAFDHGMPPVQLKLHETQGKAILSVTDQGEMKIDLKMLTKPFVKGAQSQGLGLGLSIISQIAIEMNARLEVDNHPTTFSLIFEREK